jgi:hypothetical protein
MDPDERVSEADCLSIQDRTLDWLVGKFGPFGTLGDAKQTPNAHTEKGTGYNINRSGGGFLVFVERKLAKGRNIDLLSNYINTDETTCRIDITFRDADSGERWSMSPDEQADFGRITNPSKSNADPAQEPDASMDNDDGSEDFSSVSSDEKGDQSLLVHPEDDRHRQAHSHRLAVRTNPLWDWQPLEPLSAASIETR